MNPRFPQPPRRLAWLAFAPSLVAGAAGAAALLVWPFPYEPRVPLGPALLVGLATGGVLLGLAAGLSKMLPSFRHAERATERVLKRLRLSPAAAGGLAIATSLGEEVLFRGALLPAIGLVPQAILFGLLHPAGRKGWSYSVYAVASALLLGGLVLVTGRLLPAILAHLVVNATGLLQGRRRRPSARAGSEGRSEVSPGSPPSGPPPR